MHVRQPSEAGQELLRTRGLRGAGQRERGAARPASIRSHHAEQEDEGDAGDQASGVPHLRALPQLISEDDLESYVDYYAAEARNNLWAYRQFMDPRLIKGWFPR